ncbi:NADPH-dependent F420 reductase [Streptomyces sp. NPDC058548]|uniref:NADPH-dependent F420 reductase n=1 Tax=unclassified Streptomyces TaxID=2593676 RepID=UPI00365FCE8B
MAQHAEELGLGLVQRDRHGLSSGGAGARGGSPRPGGNPRARPDQDVSDCNILQFAFHVLRRARRRASRGSVSRPVADTGNRLRARAAGTDSSKRQPERTEGSTMKIGIIGAGNIGGNLTRRLTSLGHDVSVANSRGPETLAALVEETGATAVTASEAARGAEIVVVTVPLKNVPDLPAGFLDGAADGFVVIDTGNYYPRERDGRIAEIEDEGLTESRWTERRIGHPVIKAFNGTYAQDLLERPRPAGDPERLALPVAGDDAVAKKRVRLLIDELGFDSVDAGGIDDSWRQQPDTPVYGLREGVEAVTKALGSASPERPEGFRG